MENPGLTLWKLFKKKDVLKNVNSNAYAQQRTEDVGQKHIHSRPKMDSWCVKQSNDSSAYIAWRHGVQGHDPPQYKLKRINVKKLYTIWDYRLPIFAWLSYYVVLFNPVPLQQTGQSFDSACDIRVAAQLRLPASSLEKVVGKQSGAQCSAQQASGRNLPPPAEWGDTPQEAGMGEKVAFNSSKSSCNHTSITKSANMHKFQQQQQQQQHQQQQQQHQQQQQQQQHQQQQQQQHQQQQQQHQQQQQQQQ